MKKSRIRETEPTKIVHIYRNLVLFQVQAKQSAHKHISDNLVHSTKLTNLAPLQYTENNC